MIFNAGAFLTTRTLWLNEKRKILDSRWSGKARLIVALLGQGNRQVQILRPWALNLVQVLLGGLIRLEGCEIKAGFEICGGAGAVLGRQVRFKLQQLPHEVEIG